MLHAELTSAAKALNMYDRRTGADSGRQRDDQGIGNGEKDFDSAKPVDIALHLTVKDSVKDVIVVCDVVVSACRYWPFILYTQYGPCRYGEYAVERHQEKQIILSEQKC